MRVQPPRRWGRRDFMKVVAALGQAAGLGAYDMRSAAAGSAAPDETRFRIHIPPDLCRA
jgi:hypothetical protein